MKLTGTMLTAFTFILLCGLCICTSIQPQKNFDQQKFAGKWYRLAMACESQKCSMFKDRMRISMYVLTPQDNGNVNVTVWKQRSSGCHSKDLTYHKSAVPGHFTYYSHRHQKMKQVTVMETDYTSYATVLKNMDENKEYMKLSLYGRTQNLDSELTEKFKQLSLSRGISQESIWILPPADEDCFPRNI